MEEKNSEKKERKMRDSGIPWIGEVPEGWKIGKIKNCCTLIGSGTTPSSHITEYYDNEKINWIQSGDIYGKIKIFDVKTRISTKAVLNNQTLKIYKAPFIVMAMYGGSVGNTAISMIDACTNQACCCLKPDDDTDFMFLYYWVQFCKDNFLMKAEGGGQPNISQEKIKNQYFCAPLITEQHRIADFLDSKCSEIDALVENLRARMESAKEYKKAVITEAVTKGLDKDVKMKDSGVEWIGEIPENWTNSRIKYEIIPLQRPVKNNDLIVTCFRDGTVTTRQNRREEGFTISLTENGYQGVNIGDLVIHGMDAFAGAIGCSDSRGKITPVVHVCKTIGNNRFFMFLLRSMATNDVLMSYSDGVRIRSSDYRNFNKLGKFSIAVPPVNEQSQIADYLDSKCSEIDALLQNYENQIATLEEYKKSLIYEYVTGKKEVPVA